MKLDHAIVLLTGDRHGVGLASAKQALNRSDRAAVPCCSQQGPSLASVRSPDTAIGVSS